MGIAFLLRKPKKIKQEEGPYVPNGKIYGVNIERFVSNSTNKVVYIDDAVDSVPARGNNGDFIFGSWENRYPFNRIKPCLLQNGAVVGYLNKNDYRYYEDGTFSDIIGGNFGDVMIEIPKVYYKFERNILNSDLMVRYSDTKHDDSWVAYAHTDSNGVEKDYIYLGAYLGSGSTLMYSLSGKSPFTAVSASDMELMANRRGDGYDVMGHHQLTLMQILFLVMFKSFDTYNILGQGVQSGGSDTGTANTKGMFYGTTSRTESVKFCGMEDFYGNKFQYIKGIHFNGSSEYTLNGQYVASGTTLSGITLDVFGTNTMGFIPKETGSSSTYAGLYYQADGTTQINRNLQFGLASGSYVNRGAFSYTPEFDPSSRAQNRSARLMYV